MKKILFAFVEQDFFIYIFFINKIIYDYEKPEIEVIEISVEKGFANSDVKVPASCGRLLFQNIQILFVAPLV